MAVNGFPRRASIAFHQIANGIKRPCPHLHELPKLTVQPSLLSQPEFFPSLFLHVTAGQYFFYLRSQHGTAVDAHIPPWPYVSLQT